jgi:CDP-diacylglycerol--glycerol-3-phosphate 3-phosphatidyltransferase
VIKATVGKNLDVWIRRLFPFLFWGRLDPNTLTVAGALVSTGAAALFAAGSPRLAGAVILAGGFFDLVDGVVARHRGIATRFGAFLDSTLDRWTDVVLLSGISVYFARLGQPEHVALAGFALAVTVLVSYSKARAELVLERFEVGLMERAERVVLLAAGAIFGLLVAALWVIAIGSAITAGQRIALAYREMQRLDAADANLEKSS